MSRPAESQPTANSVASTYESARKWIGYKDVVELGTIRRVDFQRFAVAVGDLNPTYFDEDAARAAGYATVVAPPLFLTSVMGWRPGPLEAELREDGLAELDSFLVSIPGLRLMGGGQDVELHGPVLDGAVVAMRRQLVDVAAREGKSGPLILFTVRREFVEQGGKVLASCKETFIGRWTE